MHNRSSNLLSLRVSTQDVVREDQQILEPALELLHPRASEERHHHKAPEHDKSYHSSKPSKEGETLSVTLGHSPHAIVQVSPESLITYQLLVLDGNDLASGYKP